MAEFAKVLPFTLQAEGGFCDDPLDPGGATNWGITLGTLSGWRGHTCSVADIRELRATEAGAIYQAHYWAAVDGETLPGGLDLLVFDFGVNAGPETSVRLLQRMVGVTADGIMGPQTAARCACSVATMRSRKRP